MPKACNRGWDYFTFYLCTVDAAVRQKIVVPTLVIWGSKDPVLEQKAAEMSSEHVVDFTIKCIESAYHFVHWDEPQQVNLLMRQFLGR